MHCFIWLLFNFFYHSTCAQDEPDNTTEPLSSFISRPDLHPLALNVSIQNSNPIDGYLPGYVFMCPYRTEQTGPYIYDKSGNLVWSGYNDTESKLDIEINTHTLHPCEYEGSINLCMWKGTQESGSGAGKGLIMNDRYEIVREYQTGDGAPTVDFHESYLISGGDHALVAAYNPIEHDLTAYNITADQQWLIEGMFQEIDIQTNEVVFEWHSIDHIALEAGHVLPGESEVAGNGTTKMSGWDYFHINSIDKSSITGNYMISARHVSAVYCINGIDGSVIWTLSYGAANNSFAFDNFNFTFQHDARFMVENGTHTVISLFDNASNDFNKTGTESSGMIIALDHEAETASLLEQTRAPRPGGILAGSQANYQTLPNGGSFIGWGSVPAVSEANAAGEAVFYADFGSWVYNYRAYTGNWTGKPDTLPTLVVPAQYENDTTPLVAYFSWNGATEVQRWRLWGSTNNETGFQELDEIDKAGFESRWAGDYIPFIRVEALDKSGISLANSTTVGVARKMENGTTVEPTSTSSPTDDVQSDTTAQPSETDAATQKRSNASLVVLLLGISTFFML